MFPRFSRPSFRPAPLVESFAPLDNPCRGWFHLYPFSLSSGRPPEEEVFLQPEESLALVRVDMGDFRGGPFPPQAMDQAAAILELFHRAGKQMILRFAYDVQGLGPEREPGSAGTIFRHMEQLGPLFQKYAADILVIQGAFVGRWGELHGSRFLAGGIFPRLFQALDKACGGKCCLAVRTPAQWRQLADQAVPARRLALFNDGIFGSDTDLGTYGSLSRTQAGEAAPWTREEELAWQSETLAGLPNGGEALAGTGRLTSSKEGAGILRRMGISYLNASYQPELLDHWKGEALTGPGGWAGSSGYDYIGCLLGYRLVARHAAVKRGRVTVRIENVGFAAPCRTLAAGFLALGPDGREAARGEFAITGGFAPEDVTELSAVLPGEALAEGAGLHLWMRMGERPVRLANEGAGEALLLGTAGE